MNKELDKSKQEEQSPLSPFNKGQTAFSLFGAGKFKVNNNGQIPLSEAFDKAFTPPQPTEAAERVRPATTADR